MKATRSHLRPAAFLLACLLFVTAMPTAVRAASSDEIKEELSGLKSKNTEIQSQISAIRGQYNANATEIKELVDKKNAIDQEIGLLHSQIINVNDQIQIYAQLVADSQEHLEAAQHRLDDLNRRHKDRVQAMEEEGKLTYWKIIFQSRSITEMLDRMEMIEEITKSDLRRLDEMKAAADVVQSTQDQLNDERSSLQEMQAQLTEAEAELEIRRTESDETLRQLAEKQEEFQELLDQSEALQDSLMKEIAAKQKELKAAEYKEELAKQALRGENPKSNASWQTPVSGYTITSPFGMRIHPVYGYSLMHNGIDMACPQGTPIYATRGGTVSRAAFQAGGAGYYVSLDHGDGFGSIYMHMTHYVVSQGQSVKQGQLIGYVGSTGVSTGPHLHFGVSYAGTYVNPMAYI